MLNSGKPRPCSPKLYKFEKFLPRTNTLAYFIPSPSTRNKFYNVGTRNLDHVIERSRSVVPALIDAIEKSDGKTLNVDYFHKLLVRKI